MMDLEKTLNEEEREAGNVTVDNDAFDIIVKNGISGQKTMLYVVKGNSLGQVFDATADTLGFDMDSKNACFVNETTQVLVVDAGLTLGEFKVEENTVITIMPGRCTCCP